MMTAINVDNITHSIQLALAPAFLLTAIASMIATLSTRLGRVIDRFRDLKARVSSSQTPIAAERAKQELTHLRLRGHIVNICIGLLTVSAFLIASTIFVLFLTDTTNFSSTKVALFTFISSIILFLLSLAGFLCETLISARTLKDEAE
jgi:Na+/melibiose symporter-like transporter